MSEHLFAKVDLSQVLQNHRNMAQREIDNFGEDYLLGASESDLVNYVVSKVTLDVPQLGEAFMLEPTEVEVDVGHDPMWGIRHGQSSTVKGCRVEIRVPFTGDPDLFLCRPSTFTFNPPQATVTKNYLIFTYARPGQLQPADVKNNFDQTLEHVK